MSSDGTASGETEASHPRSGWSRRARWSAGVGALVVTGALALTGHVWSGLGTTPTGERLERMQRSPNYWGGKFHNAIPQGPISMVEMIEAFVHADDSHRTPAEAVPVASPRVAEPREEGLRATWLGHSTILLELDGARVLTDPIFSQRTSPSPYLGPIRFHPPPLSVEELPTIDVVILSHDHYDHLDEASIEALANRDVPFVAPLGVGAHLAYWGVPEARIHELDWWDEISLGGLRIVCVPARHASGRAVLDRDATLWAGWVLVGEEHRAYFSGDTGMFEGFTQIGERLGPFDLTMIEVGAYDALWPDWHLGPELAVRAHREVRGSLLLPIHWGTFDLGLHNWTEPMERLQVAAREASIRHVTPRPGETIDIADPPAPVAWWPDIPWRSAAEEPIVPTGLNPSVR